MIGNEIDPLIFSFACQAVKHAVVINWRIAEIERRDVGDDRPCFGWAQGRGAGSLESGGRGVEFDFPPNANLIDHGVGLFLGEGHSCFAIFQGLHACRVVQHDGDTGRTDREHGLAQSKYEQGEEQ